MKVKAYINFRIVFIKFSLVTFDISNVESSGKYTIVFTYENLAINLED